MIKIDMQKSKIPTIIGIFILLSGIVTGVLLVNSKQIFQLNASNEETPQNVRVSNVTDTSLTITWTTAKESLGIVKWGKGGTFNFSESDSLGSKNYLHSVTLRELEPGTTYFFKINSGGNDYDNAGSPWEATTGITLEPSATILASGQILTGTGQAAKNALVFLTVGGGSLLSTTTSANGNWVATLSLARNKDLESLVTIDKMTTLVEISVNAGPNGIASAQIYPQAANPTPTMVLGESYDFKNLPPNESTANPEVELAVPNATEKPSAFDFAQTTATPSAKTVTLESIKEKEVINTTNPEFFGSGPKGTTLTVTVESENPQTANVKVASDGSWKWSPPEGLAPGEHTVTIKWLDTSGILRQLTKTFIVQAAEGPAYVATPSASITASPKATATIKATAPSEITDSGSLTPTLVLSIMGVGVVAFAVLLWKQAET